MSSTRVLYLNYASRLLGPENLSAQATFTLILQLLSYNIKTHTELAGPDMPYCNKLAMWHSSKL